MPDILDAWPIELDSLKFADLDTYLDGQVYRFTADEITKHLATDWRVIYNRDIEDVHVRDRMRTFRGRLAFVANRKGGTYMYQCKITDDYLYFVYGPRTCMGRKWCKEVSVEDGRCADHQRGE